MKYDIVALKRKMLVKYPFFGSVLANVGYKESRDISTASTDGETIYYNPEFLESISVEEQIFIFAHEVCHIAFNHILRSEDKDPELWNVATDGVVNQLLKRDGLKMVTGAVDISEAINYDAEQLYEKLLKEKQQSQPQQQNYQQSSSNGQSGNGQQQSQPQQQDDDSQNQDKQQNQENQQESGDRQIEDKKQQSQPQQQDDDSQNQDKQQNQENQQESGGRQSEDKKQQSQPQQQDDDSQNQDKQQNQENQQESSVRKSEDKKQQSQPQNNYDVGSLQEQDKQSQEQRNGESDKGSQKEEKQKDIGHDTHSMWEEEEIKPVEQVKSRKKESILDKILGKYKKSRPQRENDNSENQDEQLQEQRNGESIKDSQNQVSQQQSSVRQSEDKKQESQPQNNSDVGSLQEQDKQSQEQSNGESDKGSQKEEKQKDAGHDTHSMWEEAVKKHKKEQEKENNKLKKKQEELESMGEINAFKKNLEDKKKQLEELKETISKQALQAGTSTNRDVIKVNNIGTAKPMVDWRYILRETIKYDVDWSYKNATLEDGIVTPNLEEQPMPETEIVLDTSGSVNEVLLRNFLRECKNILKNTKLKVGCFDTEFYGFHEIRTEKDIENMKLEGGGGTDFDVAVGAFSRRVENKIIFTDGQAPMPYMPLDAIWMVFGGKKINPKGGRVIHITPEQLNKLCCYEDENKTKGRFR